MKVALVYDRVNKWGGAERVLLALHGIWPDAPLYTAFYDAGRASWAKVFDVRPSIVNTIPFINRHHELFAWMTPFVFETFCFDQYDVVISVTSAEAKNIITKTSTLHVCYCLTPTRYLWSGYGAYVSRPGHGVFNVFVRKAFALFVPILRKWDLIAAARPDAYIAISKHIAQRIRTYYRRDVEKVMYPPVDTSVMVSGQQGVRGAKTDYFLVVSRLVGYKRIDIIIDAFNTLGFPLCIIGDGNERKNLEKSAKKNITIIHKYLTDQELVRYYQNCRAFVSMADEDFGIAAGEAQAAGRPVIAYRKSGIGEIVIDGVTGLLFDVQSKESLESALITFEKQTFSSVLCRQNAEFFSKETFQKNIKYTIELLYGKFTHT